jgi:hypothetical protein
MLTIAHELTNRRKDDGDGLIVPLGLFVEALGTHSIEFHRGPRARHHLRIDVSNIATALVTPMAHGTLQADMSVSRNPRST